MSNDPNDRFMISDLSSKLSAYINGGYSEQTLQTRDPAEIGDVFASEIKPKETVRKLPGIGGIRTIPGIGEKHCFGAVCVLRCGQSARKDILGNACSCVRCGKHFPQNR